MLPVAISLWGTHALGPTVAFMGWLGPRGLASIVFAVMVEDAHLAHAPTIVAATYLTVGLSVEDGPVTPLKRMTLVSWLGAVLAER